MTFEDLQVPGTLSSVLTWRLVAGHQADKFGIRLREYPSARRADAPPAVPPQPCPAGRALAALSPLSWPLHQYS